MLPGRLTAGREVGRSINNPLGRERWTMSHSATARGTLLHPYFSCFSRGLNHS